MSNGTDTRPSITRTQGTVNPPISQAEWQRWLRNRQLAQDRGNWSDGGNWIGMGPEPNAFDQLTAHSSSILTMEFPSNECVQKFRDQSATISQRLGYGYGVLFGFLLRNHWVMGIAAGLASSFLLNNAGGIQVHRGFTFRMETSLDITLNAHPWGRKEMVARTRQTLFNENNQQVQTSENSNTTDLRDYNDDTLWQMLQAVGNRRGATTTIRCPDASILIGAS